MLVMNAAMLKTLNPSMHVFAYRNMELALQVMEEQRAIMYDSAKAGWFLQYTDGKGNKNGTVYNEASDPMGPQGARWDQVSRRSSRGRWRS